MSDAPSMPRSSSVPPAPGDGNRSDSTNGELDSDTSVMEPIDTISKNEGDEAKPDSKQKRKRTSPKDQAILEAEYSQDPKPNKAARAIIVEKVDMNEKEVQIWFQNRRQINRRKSRPLLPHEIMAFGLGGMAALSSDPATDKAFGSSQTIGDSMIESEEDRTRGLEQHTISSQEARVASVGERAKSTKPGEGKTKKDREPYSESSIPALQSQSSGGFNTQISSSSITDSVFKSYAPTPGYLSNRWNAVNSSITTPSSSSSSSQTTPFITPSISLPNLPSSCPNRIGGANDFTPSSRVRLSMSLDGKAQLISNDQSPPRDYAARRSSSGAALPQKRSKGLQRSQSAYSSLNSTFAPRLSRGRSRDARTWEFCCDPDARDELTTQAENESTGSAVAAISLVRSTSKTALNTNTNKRNAPSSKSDLGMHNKKPKLGRTMSSLARLQNTEKIGLNKDKEPLIRSPSGDSDKENWVPGETGGNRRRPLPAARGEKHSQTKAILEDNHNILTHAHNLGGIRSKKRKGAFVEPKIFEDQENLRDVGKEVENFMRGTISPSKKGDLDCVQGLLSLSQGNWR